MGADGCSETGRHGLTDRAGKSKVRMQEDEPHCSGSAQGCSLRPESRLQVPPATEVGLRLCTWVARVSRLSPRLRGQVHRVKTLEADGGEAGVEPVSLPQAWFGLCIRERSYCLSVASCRLVPSRSFR